MRGQTRRKRRKGTGRDSGGGGKRRKKGAAAGMGMRKEGQRLDEREKPTGNT